MAIGIFTLIGLGVGAATYGAAKKREVSTGTAAAAGAATGVTTAVATSIAWSALPIILLGAGAYGVYQLVKGDDPPQALPPGRS